MDLKQFLQEYEHCSCRQKHECSLKDVQIGSGYVHRVGEILKKNGFPRNLLLVADKTTLAVSEGITQSLKDFDVTLKVYDRLRVARMDDVRAIEAYFNEGIEAVLSVGTGSLNDPCRLACARHNKMFAIFATAPSMDGFASASSPIVDHGFKLSYQAKNPEVIIADTKILAQAPVELKSAGFGDMVAKYVALIDWKISNIVLGLPCCEKVFALTRYAADRVMRNADKVTANDEKAAAVIFEGLLYTGMAMGFVKNSHPASGAEHVMAHYMECKELLEGKEPNFHGEDVGVCTLVMLEYYERLAQYSCVRAHRERNDWQDICEVYGPLAEEMLKLNTPHTITEEVDLALLEEKFGEFRALVKSVPSSKELRDKMKIAGCKTTIAEIGKTETFARECFFYHPYMRRRVSFRRLANMMDFIQ